MSEPERIGDILPGVLEIIKARCNKTEITGQIAGPGLPGPHPICIHRSGRRKRQKTINKKDFMFPEAISVHCKTNKTRLKTEQEISYLAMRLPEAEQAIGISERGLWMMTNKVDVPCVRVGN